MNDPNLSIEGRQKEAGMAVAARGSRIRELLEDAHSVIARDAESAERALGKAREPDPGELQARAAVLAPNLQMLSSPQEWANLYRARFAHRTDRFLIEEAAELRIAALGGSDGGALAKQFRGAREELSMQAPPEVREAEDDLEELAELDAALGALERVVGAALDGLRDGGSPSGEGRIGASMTVAEWNTYATRYGGRAVPNA